MPKIITVAAAVVERDDRVLVADRPDGTMQGKWEFPGGKLEPGETPACALRRELREELGVKQLHVLDTLGRAFFQSSNKFIRIFFIRCRLGEGEDPAPLEGQKVMWAERRAMSALEFLPADREFVAANFR